MTRSGRASAAPTVAAWAAATSLHGRSGPSVPPANIVSSPDPAVVQARLGHREGDHAGVRGDLDGQHELAVARQPEVGPVQRERQGAIRLRGERWPSPAPPEDHVAMSPRIDHSSAGADPVQRVAARLAPIQIHVGAASAAAQQGLGAGRGRGGVLAEPEVGDVAGSSDGVDGRHRLGDRGLEAVEQVGDRLVDGGDARHGPVGPGMISTWSAS